MIHLVVTAIVTVCIALFRGALSVVGFLLKLIGRLFRLVLSLLPVTGAALLLTCAFLVFFAFTGTDPLPAALPWHPEGRPFLASFGAIFLLIHDLRSTYPGIVSVLILIAAIILGIPVILALLLAHALIALVPVLFFLLITEIAVYLLYGILTQKTPFTQIRDRYYALFPRSANRHYERTYHAWLKRHAGEFADDSFGMPNEHYRNYARSRYDDGRDDDADNWRDDDRLDRKDRRRAEKADRRRRRIEAYYDEYDENAYEEAFADEEAQNDWNDRGEAGRDQRNRRASFFDFNENDTPRSAFNFFAGCSDLTSVEKKYRSLVKLYHPDNQDGDTAAIQEINAQYAEAKRRLR